MWLQRLPIEFKEKYKEDLPDNIKDYLPYWDDALTMETVRGTERKILYPPKSSHRPAIPNKLKPNVPPQLNKRHKCYFSMVIDCADFYIQLLESQID